MKAGSLKIGTVGFYQVCPAASQRLLFDPLIFYSQVLLIMEVDFCPALCIQKVPVLQAFWGISHFVWYCKAVSDLS